MITVRDKSTIANISELREKEKSEEILRNLKDHKVILEKHNSPVAVMIDYQQFETLEKMLEFAEDYVLGMIAARRDRTAKKEDFIDLDKW
jgi:PHD/YefM family antitoxin component YafN of YafNO toxin-antitoxin module